MKANRVENFFTWSNSCLWICIYIFTLLRFGVQAFFEEPDYDYSIYLFIQSVLNLAFGFSLLFILAFGPLAERLVFRIDHCANNPKLLYLLILMIVYLVAPIKKQAVAFNLYLASILFFIVPNLVIAGLVSEEKVNDIERD